MKKHLKLMALLSAAVLLLCACSVPENGDSSDQSFKTSTTQNNSSTHTAITSNSSTTNSTTSSSTTSSSEIPKPDNTPDTSWLPRMDGSTSAIPLEVGLKSGFLGISYNEAKKLVSHTTTHDSFKRLIKGDVDLIFSVPISEEQQKLADDAGVKLIMEPVAREGFVFAVNAENPVDSLTSEQLRKIYSGEITNWSQVGGNDEAILPYQRNTDSGSQNYMTVFMGDTELMPPRSNLVEGMMGSLMDAIAVYDNSAGAIGYSVYSYAAQMYANANKVKFIAVDGVAPSKATMADESYPLLSCTYMIYTDKSPESAKDFAEKALSDEGQTYVLESGYLPVNGMDVPEKYLPYEAVGTGEPRPADYTPSDKFMRLTFPSENAYAIGNGLNRTGDGYFSIAFLKNKEFQAQINGDIRAAMDRLCENGMPSENNNMNLSHISADRINNIKGISIGADCRNGYLSLILEYQFNDVYFADVYSQAETLIYDLISEKRLEHFSDLFFKDEDFLPEVNNSIAEYINQDITHYTDIEPKLDFSGILGEPRIFTFGAVGLEPDNMYFTSALLLNYSNGSSIVRQYRDMSSVIADEYRENLRDEDYYYYDEWKTAYSKDENGDIYKRFVGSPIHTTEEVKAQDELWYGLQKRAWAEFRKLVPGWYSNYSTISTGEYENHYSVGHFSVVGGEPRALFDKDTMELITPEMLIGENWRQYLPEDDQKDGKSYIVTSWWNSADSGAVSVIVFGEQYTERYFSVPAEKMNRRYYTTR